MDTSGSMVTRLPVAKHSFFFFLTFFSWNQGNPFWQITVHFAGQCQCLSLHLCSFQLTLLWASEGMESTCDAQMDISQSWKPCLPTGPCEKNPAQIGPWWIYSYPGVHSPGTPEYVSPASRSSFAIFLWLRGKDISEGFQPHIPPPIAFSVMTQGTQGVDT